MFNWFKNSQLERGIYKHSGPNEQVDSKVDLDRIMDLSAKQKRITNDQPHQIGYRIDYNQPKVKQLFVCNNTNHAQSNTGSHNSAVDNSTGNWNRQFDSELRFKK